MICFPQVVQSRRGRPQQVAAQTHPTTQHQAQTSSIGVEEGEQAQGPGGPVRTQNLAGCRLFYSFRSLFLIFSMYVNFGTLRQKSGRSSDYLSANIC